MKRLHYTLAALEIGMVLVLSMARPVDDPETSYNESETTINFAAPVAIDPASDANPLVEVKGLVTVMRSELRRVNNSVEFASMLLHTTSASDFRLKLLRTLIC
jgi:hypothetical protein